MYNSKKAVSNMFEYIRQLKYPKAFRIKNYPWPSMADIIKTCAQGKGNVDSDEAHLGRMGHFITDMATNLWRLKQKMLRPGTNDPLDEMKRAYRHFESAWDALISAGIEVHDHTGIAYDTGLSLKVVAFQPTEGLKRETVLETIKPTIYFQGKQIQMGAVVVGRPLKS